MRIQNFDGLSTGLDSFPIMRIPNYEGLGSGLRELQFSEEFQIFRDWPVGWIPIFSDWARENFRKIPIFRYFRSDL